MGFITQAQQQHCPPRPGAQHCQAQHEHIVPTDLEVPALGPGRVLYFKRPVHLDHELPNAMVPLHRVRKLDPAWRQNFEGLWVGVTFHGHHCI